MVFSGQKEGAVKFEVSGHEASNTVSGYIAMLLLCDPGRETMRGYLWSDRSSSLIAQSLRCRMTIEYAT